MRGEVILAPAKLTLSLRITGVREDGYHLLDAEMVTLDFADELSFAEGDGLTVSGPSAAGVGRDDTNLVRRALAVMGRRARVSLVKRIPASAGLGGGSADAGAVLRWAGCDDVALAASLGSDVPFCVLGGHARVRGIGDVLEPLAFEEQTFTIVIPSLAVSTGSVYRRWDELGGPTGDAGNDLEPALLPQVARWRDLIESATGERPRLAGSGSAWFVEGDFGAARIAGAQVVVARTVPSGWSG